MAERISKEVRNYLSKIGHKGGLKGGPARAEKLTPERRQEIGRKAIMARWGKRAQ